MMVTVLFFPIFAFVLLAVLSTVFAAAMANPVLRRGIVSAFCFIVLAGGVAFVVLTGYRYQRVTVEQSQAQRWLSAENETQFQAQCKEADSRAAEFTRSASFPAQTTMSSATSETHPRGRSESKDASKKADKDSDAARPAWITTPPKADDSTFYMVKKVGPYTTPVECDGEISKVLQASLSEYVELYLGREASDEVHLSDDELRKHIVDRYQETVLIKLDNSTQTMYQVYLKLAFDRDIQSHIRTAWNDALVMARMRKTGAGLGGTLFALALVYAGLRSRQARAR